MQSPRFGDENVNTAVDVALQEYFNDDIRVFGAGVRLVAKVCSQYEPTVEVNGWVDEEGRPTEP